MTIYFIYYSVLLGLGAVLQWIGALKRKGGRVFYLVLVAVALTVIGGARDFGVSYDGTTYASVFRTFSALPWLPPQKYTYFMEYGFYVFCKLIAVCGGNARTMFWISSGFVAFSVCSFLYRNTEHIFSAVVILLSFPYLYTSFDLIRYYLAVSIVLLAFPFVKKRKFLPYCCVIAAACMFHKTAVIYLLLYFLPLLHWNGLTAALTFCGMILVSALAHPLAAFFSKLFNDYTSYVSGMNTNWIGAFAGGIKTAGMYLLIAAIAAYVYSGLEEKTPKQNQNLGYVILTAAVSVIFVTSSIAVRLLVAFLPFMSVGLAEVLYAGKSKMPKTRVFLQYITLLLCLAYHAFLILNNWQHIVPYSFGN